MTGDGQGMWHVSEEETCILGSVGKAEGSSYAIVDCCLTSQCDNEIQVLWLLNIGVVFRR
jgi:hypothetical protein